MPPGDLVLSRDIQTHTPDNNDHSSCIIIIIIIITIIIAICIIPLPEKGSTI